MKKLRTNKPRLSQQHPILLAYGVANIILLIFTQIKNFSNYYEIQHLTSLQYSISQSIVKDMIILGSLIILAVAVAYLYLIISSDLAKVKLLLKIFLGFQLLGLLLVVLRGSTLIILITAIQACFTFTTLNYVSGKNSSVVL